uniref:Uncharacterized protein n=1 Tax=Oryza sativa subsp. japonica TaxID=39947 RepID=Q69NY3_ORYSJ|nr:hypothetical protein [Oryza sativa Japonica Group]
MMSGLRKVDLLAADSDTMVNSDDNVNLYDGVDHNDRAVKLLRPRQVTTLELLLPHQVAAMKLIPPRRGTAMELLPPHQAVVMALLLLHQATAVTLLPSVHEPPPWSRRGIVFNLLFDLLIVELHCEASISESMLEYVIADLHH